MYYCTTFMLRLNNELKDKEVLFIEGKTQAYVRRVRRDEN